MRKNQGQLPQANHDTQGRIAKRHDLKKGFCGLNSQLSADLPARNAAKSARNQPRKQGPGPAASGRGPGWRLASAETRPLYLATMSVLPETHPATAGLPPAPVPVRWRPVRWPLLLGLTLGAVGVFQLLTLQRAGGGELAPLLRGEPGAYLRQFLGYYLLFELVSAGIFLGCAGWYFRRFMPLELRPTAGAALRYELRFLPAVLGSILVLGPATNTLRYLVLHYPDYRWATYFPEWFFTGQMFANYLLPLLLLGYGLLNANLLLDFYHWPRPAATVAGPAAAANPATAIAATAAEPLLGLQCLTVFDAEGETLLPVRELRYVEVAARKQYRAHDRQGRAYDLRLTLAELEAGLDPRLFFRLNRSVLVNLACVRNYSYWENDKYIVRLDDGRAEFVMARARLAELRTRLARRAVAPGAA